MAEYIDIYDANLSPIGQMERIEAHRKGEWHQTFHCWIVTRADGPPAVVFQQRSPTMKNFPGMLDVSAAGHLEAGEPLEGGIREVEEELGIPIAFERLHNLGYRVEVADQANGQRNREYQGVFMYETESQLMDFKAEPEEISALILIPIREGIELFSDARAMLEVTGFRFSTAAEGAWEAFEQEVNRESFLPRIQQYYLTVMIMAERLVSDAGPLAIS